jgi:hypothetical protein
LVMVLFNLCWISTLLPALRNNYKELYYIRSDSHHHNMYIPAQGKHTYTTLSNVLWYYFDMNCGWFIYHLNNVFILWFLYSKIITLCDNKYLISFSAVRVGFTLNTLDVCLDNKTILYGCWCSLQMNI